MRNQSNTSEWKLKEIEFLVVGCEGGGIQIHYSVVSESAGWCTLPLHHAPPYEQLSLFAKYSAVREVAALYRKHGKGLYDLSQGLGAEVRVRFKMS